MNDNQPSKSKSKPKRKEKDCFHCGSIGHLAKHCPQLVNNNNDGPQYIPPKRIQFKTEADLEDFKDRVIAFKFQCRKKDHLEPQLYKPMLEELLSYLVSQYTHRKDKFVVNMRNIRLAFGSHIKGEQKGTFGFAETSGITGYITFSTVALEDHLIDSTDSGYDKEGTYKDKWCKTKEDYLFWLLIHEFTHLFTGHNNDRHDEEFFDLVEDIASDHSFLFE